MQGSWWRCVICQLRTYLEAVSLARLAVSSFPGIRCTMSSTQTPFHGPPLLELNVSTLPGVDAASILSPTMDDQLSTSLTAISSFLGVSSFPQWLSFVILRGAFDLIQQLVYFIWESLFSDLFVTATIHSDDESYCMSCQRGLLSWKFTFIAQTGFECG